MATYKSSSKKSYGSKKTTGKTNRTGSSTAPGYAPVYNNIQCKINSFRAIANQTKGSAKYPRPSASTLNTFTNWVNKGANVYTVSNAQLTKWAGKTKAVQNYNNWNTSTACKSFLASNFGKNAIKAVTKTKTGSWMIACTPAKGKSFNWPKG